MQSANPPNWNQSTINNRFSYCLLSLTPLDSPKRETTPPYGESPRDPVITSLDVDSFKFGWLKIDRIAIVDL